MTMETERRETGTLIGSDKVEGTAVYGTDAQKIGSIERVMIDKSAARCPTTGDDKETQMPEWRELDPDIHRQLKDESDRGAAIINASRFMKKLKAMAVAKPGRIALYASAKKDGRLDMEN
jgi:hypothetical protein